MARSEIVYLTDDFTGKPDEGTETIPFMMEDGKPREIDLNPKNAKIFRDKMNRYVEASRIVAPKSSKRKGNKNTTVFRGRTDASEIRAWAHENGIEINERGRIPVGIVEQYDSRNVKTDDAPQDRVCSEPFCSVHENGDMPCPDQGSPDYDAAMQG